MAAYKNIFIATILTFSNYSAFACKYVLAIDVFYEKGAVNLTNVEEKKLQDWLDASLVKFPFVGSIGIEANAYAPNLEDAEILAATRGNLLKIRFSTKLPADTIIQVGSFGHTSPKRDVLPTTDVVFIDITPDVEKMKLPPCSPRPKVISPNDFQKD